MHALLAPLAAFAVFVTTLAHGWLGVLLDPNTDAAVVTQVVDGSPAQKAGLAAGDVIVAVGERNTPTRDELIAAVQSHKAGDKVRLKIERGGKHRFVVVSLAERPETVEVTQGVEVEVPEVMEEVVVEAVPMLEDVTDRPAYLGLAVRETDRGVVVDRAVDGGPAAAAGVPAGGLLVAIGDHRIQALGDLDKALAGLRPGQRVALQLEVDGGKRSILVQLGVRGGAAADAWPPAVRAPAVRVAPPEAVAVPVAPKAAKEPKAPKAAKEPKAGKAEPAPRADDLQAELEALRAELADLRKQLEELRKRSRQAR